MLKGAVMKLYLAAVIIAVSSTAMLVHACMFHASAQSLVPINIIQFK
jgi:hypothetical protein